MLTAERFLANREIDFRSWMEFRRNGVTASDISASATPESIKRVSKFRHVPDTPAMRFGREYEGTIAMYIKNDFGVMPNEWLIAGETKWHLATPDGISLDHKVVSEIKTTGTDWETWAKAPKKFNRQVQWQMHVTGAETCVFAWMLRGTTDNNILVPLWLEPKMVVVERDQETINELVVTASKIWEFMGGERKEDARS